MGTISYTPKFTRPFVQDDTQTDSNVYQPPLPHQLPTSPLPFPSSHRSSSKTSLGSQDNAGLPLQMCLSSD